MVVHYIDWALYTNILLPVYVYVLACEYILVKYHSVWVKLVECYVWETLMEHHAWVMLVDY